MSARMYVHKLRYFLETWNLLDFPLVCLAVFDTWISKIFKMEADLRMLSVLRVVRLLRLVRLIRLLRVFKELYLLVNGFIEALRVLTWIFFLLAVVLYISAILCSLTLGEPKACEKFRAELGPRAFGGEECEDVFGGVVVSMYTLFQVMTLESWAAAIARPVMKLYPATVLFFLCFLFLTMFGLMNIVVGVIVENTLAAAAQNEDKIKARKQKQMSKVLGQLRDIFLEADQDGSGTIDKEEFLEIAQRPDAIEQFKALELPIESEAGELFDILDEDKIGEISIKVFIEGALKLKGAAKSKDLMGLVCNVRSVGKRLERSERRLTKVTDVVNSLPEVVERSVREAYGSTKRRPRPKPNEPSSPVPTAEPYNGAARPKLPNGFPRGSARFEN
jgi:hypothetical protein